MISFVIPSDQELLAAIGEVALRHEHLTYVLRMTIKSIARLAIDEALDATEYDGARDLRERIKKLARQKLGEGEALLRLQALITRCARATDKRNAMIHGIWAKELDGDLVQRGAGNSWGPPPSREQLLQLANELKELTWALNEARLDVLG